jgi:tetratricopeptide (TPR) repeat protein
VSAESHYLNALEALESNEVEQAIDEAKKTVSIDPEHIDAWNLLSDLYLLNESNPSLQRAAQSLSALKKVLELDPERLELWVRGGRLLADDLGLLHDALKWWQDCRHIAPNEVTPIVEQASILADMGEYEHARKRLETILDENMDVATSQFAKINGLLQLVRAAQEQDRKDIFRPQEKNHNAWRAIEYKMKKPPVSENYIFLLTTVPFLFLVVLSSQRFAGDGWAAFCFTSLVILISVLFGVRFSRKMFQIANRPAFNLLRAMNFEASTGFVVISEEIRTSVLYMYIMQRKPKAWQERMLRIIETGKELPSSWKLHLPDFDSHLDVLPVENDEQGFTAYEEE